MSKIQIILNEPQRSNAARALFKGNEVAAVTSRDEFRGPVFDDADLTIAGGAAKVTVMSPEPASYYYPLHTIARIKESV